MKYAASADNHGLAPFPAVLLPGDFGSFCVPATLYHGTSSGCVGAILAEGLRPDIRAKQSRLSLDCVYLSTDASMAAHLARSRAARAGDEPVVLAVSAGMLEADSMGFDLNMCGVGWSESIVYSAVVPAAAIVVMPREVARLEAGLMLLGDPVPGERPLAFDMAWARAAEFLAHVELDAEESLIAVRQRERTLS